MIPRGALVLLDTNVLILLVRNGASGKQIQKDYDLAGRAERPLISIVTVGEAKAFARKLSWGDPKRSRLDELLRELVVVNIDAGDVLDRYAEIDYYSERIHKPARPMGKNDLWIAATAAATESWLVTTDNDFDHLVPDFFRRIKINAATGVTLL